SPRPQPQANTTAALRLGVKLASDQPEGFVRDDLFELVLYRAGTSDVSCSGFRGHMVPPVSTQSVIVDCKFSRGSLDRCTGCQKTLDPHALSVIAAPTSPGSRALWSWHVISPYLYIKKSAVVCGVLFPIMQV